MSPDHALTISKKVTTPETFTIDEIKSLPPKHAVVRMAVIKSSIGRREMLAYGGLQDGPLPMGI
ncbi:molybdopterin-binding protein [Thalassoroseus pseudoceratinae]|uniref:hypothetical protein n=1 Tax=Thalassoroseus pseudoceratinae TaxID=2713176 RepID=UPI00141F1681|nr:hypothetical protein [Thalassoroseus pseudoceratinae]